MWELIRDITAKFASRIEEQSAQTVVPGLVLGAAVGALMSAAWIQAELLAIVSSAVWVAFQTFFVVVAGAILWFRAAKEFAGPSGPVNAEDIKGRVPSMGCGSGFMLATAVLLLIAGAIGILLSVVTTDSTRWAVLQFATMLVSLGVGYMYQRARPEKFASFYDQVQYWGAIIGLPQIIIAPVRDLLAVFPIM